MRQLWFVRICRAIKHLPILDKLDALWNALQGPYQGILNLLAKKGIWVPVGKDFDVRIPSSCYSIFSLDYEAEQAGAVISWLKNNRNAIFLDAGCSFGFYSVIALFASCDVEVIGIDSDLHSLASAETLCVYASGDRLKVVHGFVSDKHLSGAPFSAAVINTQKNLPRTTSGELDTENRSYINIYDNKDPSIPTHTIDGLFLAEGFFRKNRPILLKCDIEGAELLALRGAQNVLRQFAPTLAISVHPDLISEYGYSAGNVRSYLEDLGYSIKVLAIDHEEHWWCEKKEIDRRFHDSTI